VSLATYNKKRDFKRTSEPKSGRAGERKPKLTFVVQRHSARRLHYDFRLEMEGVLKSWAVPRGPTMVAGEKRLAVMVEDHPLEYGKFYGKIPEGNYGAGNVEIWDKGTFRPVTESADLEGVLADMIGKGDIKFTLNGTYLKGRFALFRLKGGEKENEWMLVKKADEFAEDTFDIESLHSIKSKSYTSQRSTKAKNGPDPFPGPVPVPMLAKQADLLAEKPGWFCEMKLDGYRILCTVRDGKVDLVSRNGNLYNNQFKALLEDLHQVEESLVIDGEVVVENSKGRSDFQLLQEYLETQSGDLKYYVFDILYLGGHDIMSFPLRRRRELLDALFGKYDFKRVIKLSYQVGGGVSLFESLSAKGYEGIIMKDPGSRYLPGKRSDSWIKVKAVLKQEAIVCGYTVPRGSRKFFGSILLGLYDDGRLKYTGSCGSGFTDTMLERLHQKMKPFETKTCPFDEPPDLSAAHGKPVWLVPGLVGSVKFLEWTANGIMRLPVFQGIREDKLPGEVINETKGSIDTGNTEKDMTAEIEGNRLRITNLTKIYWREEGYTKGDLVSYYRAIGKFMLPYLKDRPQSLNRYPGGISGQSFYHKDMDPGLVPKWVKTVRMESESHAGGINYLICNNISTLLYMVNLGCIEINPWHSTYRKPENPAYTILDLDPGNISFSKVVDTALVIKEICDEIGIDCYPKTSGATGIHIYIPLGAKYDYVQARTFAELLASIAHNRLPDVTSLERAVAKREDRVYIDFLQNRKGQTVAAAYSVRPRPLATVSAPLAWKEVNHRLTPEMFTIRNMENRLGKVGDLWEPVLGAGISLNKVLRAIEKIS
jgi:bifunctional non-homologous end joining protein LigD